MISYQVQKGTLESSIYLIEQTLNKIRERTDKECLVLLNQAITVFLRSIDFLENIKEAIVIKSVREIHFLLNDWMENSLNYFFGASKLSNYWFKQNAESEIKVINN